MYSTDKVIVVLARPNSGLEILSFNGFPHAYHVRPPYKNGFQFDTLKNPDLSQNNITPGSKWLYVCPAPRLKGFPAGHQPVQHAHSIPADQNVPVRQIQWD